MINIKTVNREDSGIRVCEVKVSSSVSFKTPTRSMTYSEHTVEEKITIDVEDPFDSDLSFKNPIIEVGESVSEAKLDKFRNQNGSFQYSKNKINSMIQVYDDAFVIYYPHMAPITPLTEADIVSLINLQKNSNLLGITIPPLTYATNIEIFKSEIEKFVKIADTAFGKKNFIIPYLDPIMLGKRKSPVFFRECLDFLLDCGSSTFPIVGLRITDKDMHTNLNQSLRHLNEVSSNCEDFLFHASGLYRINIDGTSNPHIPQWYGIDSVAIKPVRAPSKLFIWVISQMKAGITSFSSSPAEKMSKQIIEKNYLSLRDIKKSQNRFDNTNLGNIPFNVFESKHKELECQCPICKKRKSVQDFIEEYGDKKADKYNAFKINRYCKTHEMYASFEEFQMSQRFIESNEFSDYLNEKEYLKNTLSH